MKCMLHHLTGSLRGHTQYFQADSLRFGTGTDCDVRFDVTSDRQVAPSHAELSLHDHAPMLRDLTGQHALFINNRQTGEAALHDGDLIQFGQQGPLLRFRVLSDLIRSSGSPCMLCHWSHWIVAASNASNDVFATKPITSSFRRLPDTFPTKYQMGRSQLVA